MLRRTNEIARITDKYKSVIKPGKVSHYIMERKLLKIFKEVWKDRLEYYEDLILRLPPDQLEKLLSKPKERMVDEIVKIRMNKQQRHE